MLESLLLLRVLRLDPVRGPNSQNRTISPGHFSDWTGISSVQFLSSIDVKGVHAIDRTRPGSLESVLSARWARFIGKRTASMSPIDAGTSVVAVRNCHFGRARAT